MRLFELRACWEEHYDCPDYGDTKICDNYDIIGITVDDDEPLKTISKELTAGYPSNRWSLTRSQRLHELYPGFDDMRPTEYKIVEITELIINSPRK